MEKVEKANTKVVNADANKTLQSTEMTLIHVSTTWTVIFIITFFFFSKEKKKKTKNESGVKFLKVWQ